MGTIANRVKDAGTSLRILTESGIVRPYSPLVVGGMVQALVQWSTTPAGGFKTIALRMPQATAIIDERGSLTFAELQARTNALAHGLRERGVKTGDGVAVMCRNHRGFIEASIAISKLGADVLYLNTAFAGPQLADVIAREKPRVVVHDEEFTDLLAGADIADRVLGWTDGEAGPDSLDGIIDAATAADRTGDLKAPDRKGRTIILTSGTTGTPKGAPRPQGGLPAAISLLSRMPLKSGWKCHVAAPLFHTWGFAHYQLAMMLGTTLVLTRKFDPEGALKVLHDEKCDSFAVIPVMLQRILALPEGTLEKYPLPHLKAVASSGSALPGDLPTQWMDRYGDNLYSIYGSTEVAWASIADPKDLREAPGCAGRLPHQTVVRILDADGREVPTGQSGRIFVGNSLQIEGYTGGGGKEMIDGLMSSGDVGRFDADGRLYVEGRDDEMIVSGGENVFPKEVEDCLATHERVAEVAAIGVDDPEFGKRLRAFVVRVPDAEPVSSEELKDLVKINLARYKVPREIVFLDELPRNATGKVLKRELAALEPDA
ncbi:MULTISPECIES: AMP-binding protein [unclassified Nocardioides]|uniref:AMP-binding protein n=1 Tax=unclassified Nocardioides TaxID=2615069 RepID=UPI0007035A44|nr:MULTISPECIES: AMP-binding protein [unclassified Nocardioides]KRC48703.1 acyl-CoA synthetase [Nocardioides sp. Root79]KRC75103.1 acyl-CoA synthetase [Nocardioides sp. Root240]